MAHTHNGTIVNLHSSVLPAGYSKPAVTPITDEESVRENVEIEVVKSTVENASASATLTALVAAVDTAAETLVADDYDTTRTVDSHAVLKNVRTNLNHSEDFFLNVAPKYICTVDIFVKAAP